MFNLKSFLTEKLYGKKPPWQDLFKLFKEIIDSNNRALDIITDLGEKLGGDYLFDIIYIKSAYHKLGHAVGASIQKVRHAHPEKIFTPSGNFRRHRLPDKCGHKRHGRHFR